MHSAGDPRPLLHQEDAQRTSPGCCQYNILEAEATVRPKSPRCSMKGGTNYPQGEPRPLSHIEDLRDRSPGPSNYGVTHSSAANIPGGCIPGMRPTSRNNEGRSLSPDGGGKASGSTVHLNVQGGPAPRTPKIPVQSGAVFSGHKFPPALTTANRGLERAPCIVKSGDVPRRKVLRNRPHSCDVPTRFCSGEPIKTSTTPRAKNIVRISLLQENSDERRGSEACSSVDQFERTSVQTANASASDMSPNKRRMLELSSPELLEEMTRIQYREKAIAHKTGSKGTVEVVQKEKGPKQSSQKAMTYRKQKAGEPLHNEASQSCSPPWWTGGTTTTTRDYTRVAFVDKELTEAQITKMLPQQKPQNLPLAPQEGLVSHILTEVMPKLEPQNYLFARQEAPISKILPPPEPMEDLAAGLPEQALSSVTDRLENKTTEESGEEGRQGSSAFEAKAHHQVRQMSVAHDVQKVYDSNPYDPLDLQESLNAMSKAVNKIFMPEAKAQRDVSTIMSFQELDSVKEARQEDPELDTLRQVAWQRVLEVARLKATASQLERELTSMYGSESEKVSMAAIAAGAAQPQRRLEWDPVD
eukprot:gnl/MRDRNA2_/MRDRNA2_32948_c0_seq1.p1 gnl/MRDRNA2_/MRDRNA2_32948_c0~~gnl/MRDRNA2_/MRDRNA2_32948_c0_seq1.p1  ORF type:complete len:606 (-),score=103.39 gnl/MRDRNA2_/MRDRNA2_32948_c0_seq1:19-1770(-)